MGLMHARNDRLQLDRLPLPLLCSEKLDGWRLLILAQSCLTKSLLDQPNRNLPAHLADLVKLSAAGWVFDCELWSPHMSLEEIQSVLSTSDATIPSHLHAHIFDAVQVTEWFSNRAPSFERRVDRLAALLAAEKPRHASLVRHDRINSLDALHARYHSTLAAHGEGLVLRSPVGGYFHGRVPAKSKLVWKMKPETFHA